MSEQKEFFSPPGRTPESAETPNLEIDRKVEITEVPTPQENLDITEKSEASFSLPESQAVIVVEETLEQFDHAKASDDKKEEAIQLERLLADGDDAILILASEIQDDANIYGQISA